MHSSQRASKEGVAWTGAITLLAFVLCISSSPVQATNGNREILQIQAQAEDAMAQGDPQGAAITIGRAALLASQISRQQTPQPDQPPYRLMADLFRTQEQAYRALALFQQSGEQTPVSSGICTLLSLGQQHANQALAHHSATATGEAFHEPLHSQTLEWLGIIQELQKEWNCTP